MKALKTKLSLDSVGFIVHLVQLSPTYFSMSHF